LGGSGLDKRERVLRDIINSTNGGQPGGEARTKGGKAELHSNALYGVLSAMDCYIHFSILLFYCGIDRDLYRRANDMNIIKEYNE